MSLNGKRDNFELKDLLAVARLITHLEGRKVVKEVVEAVRRWSEFAEFAGMAEDNLIEQIESTHRLTWATDCRKHKKTVRRVCYPRMPYHSSVA